MGSNKKKPKAESQLMEKGGRWSSARGSKGTMHKCLTEENTGIFLNGLVFRNPVMIGALGLFPAVGTGYMMQNAAILSLMILVMTLPVCALSGWMKIPVQIRPVAVLVLSGVIYLPVAVLVRWLIPQVFSALSIYAALMIGSSIISPRASDYAPSHITPTVLMDLPGCTADFPVVIFLVMALRETWGNIVKDTDGVYHAGTYPLVGLLLLDMIAALIQRTNAKRAVAERGAK